MLAENLFLAQGAIVNMANHHIESVLFPTLQLFPNTKMIFDIENASQFTVKFRNYFEAYPTTTLDFTKIPDKVSFESIAKTYEYQSVKLGETLFSNALFVNSSQIEVSSKLEDPYNTTSSSV